MPSAPSIALDLRPSRLLAVTLLASLVAAGFGLPCLSELPIHFSLPALILIAGLEGRVWQALAATRRLVLQPSGYWSLDTDQQLWTLSGSQRFPAGAVLHLVTRSSRSSRRVTVIRDQVDSATWRRLNAWLRAARSVQVGRAPV